jgi:hypothetical protein
MENEDNKQTVINNQLNINLNNDCIKKRISSMLGKKHTEISKEKMRKSALGRKCSEETKQKMRESANKPETKLLQKTIHKGKHYSQKTEFKKGMTWEQMFGEEKAKEMRKLHSRLATNRNRSPEFIKKLTGKKRSQETRHKISLSKIGKKFSQVRIKRMRTRRIGYKATQEAKNNSSVALKKSYAEGRHPKVMLGKHHTQEAKEKISKATINMLNTKGHPLLGTKQSLETIQNRINKTIGKKRTPQFCEQQSERMKENILNGKCNNQYGKKGIREDLKEYGIISSTLEANMIRYLKYKNEIFEYQIPILLNNNRWYICDFYLPNKNKLFLEMKGYQKQIRNIQQEKYNLLQQNYPRMNWKILFQTSEEWKNIVKNYSKLIPNWEFYKR